MNKEIKTNILLLAGTLQSGGTEKHFYQLCTHLSREKFVIHVGLEEPVKNDFGPLPDDVHLLLLNGGYVNKARQLYHYTKHNRIQVIYSCAFETSLPVLLGWPVLFFRCTFYTGVRGKFNFPVTRKIPEWFISAISTQIICNSVKIKDYVPALFRNKCEVIYNGITPLLNPMSKLQAREKLKLNTTTKMVGCIARLCADKGQDVLIEAFAKAFTQDDNVQLVLIGDGEDKAKLIQQITMLNMEKHIILLGNIPNAAQYLQAFDLFALPSRTESFPNALLEAIQYGLPCVATRVGGVEEIYNIINFGYLVHPEDITGMSEALQKGVHMPAQTYDLGRFSLTQNIQAYEQVFLTA